MWPKTSYDVLGVPSNASKSEIRKAFRDLAKKWHPDKNKSKNAGDIFRRIKAAYDDLNNANDGQGEGTSNYHSFFDKSPNTRHKYKNSKCGFSRSNYSNTRTYNDFKTASTGRGSRSYSNTFTKTGRTDNICFDKQDIKINTGANCSFYHSDNSPSGSQVNIKIASNGRNNIHFVTNHGNTAGVQIRFSFSNESYKTASTHNNRTSPKIYSFAFSSFLDDFKKCTNIDPDLDANHSSSETDSSSKKSTSESDSSSSVEEQDNVQNEEDRNSTSDDDDDSGSDTDDDDNDDEHGNLQSNRNENANIHTIRPTDKVPKTSTHNESHADTFQNMGSAEARTYEIKQRYGFCPICKEFAESDNMNSTTNFTARLRDYHRTRYERCAHSQLPSNVHCLTEECISCPEALYNWSTNNHHDNEYMKKTFKCPHCEKFIQKASILQHCYTCRGTLMTGPNFNTEKQTKTFPVSPCFVQRYNLRKGEHFGLAHGRHYQVPNPKPSVISGISYTSATFDKKPTHRVTAEFDDQGKYCVKHKPALAWQQRGQQSNYVARLHAYAKTKCLYNTLKSVNTILERSSAKIH